MLSILLCSECGQVLAGRGGRSGYVGKDRGAEYLRECVGSRGEDSRQTVVSGLLSRPEGCARHIEGVMQRHATTIIS